MVVLSLCDGISVGQLALKEIGIPVSHYYASEIKDSAIKVTMDNFPNTIQLGDVNDIYYIDGMLITKDKKYYVPRIDLVIFGSPCQTFSIAMKKENRVGLEDKKKSGLFLECYRILCEVNPKYFLMENVASMKEDDKNYITKLLGVEPKKIDSQIVAPAFRKRLYWTNIPLEEKLKLVDINLQDILISGYTERKKARCLLASDSRPLKSYCKMVYRYFKTGFTTLIFKNEEQYKQIKEYVNKNYKNISAKKVTINEEFFKGIRYLNRIEAERCQTLPDNYTKAIDEKEALDVLGDSWTLKVICYLFSGLRREYGLS